MTVTRPGQTMTVYLFATRHTIHILSGWPCLWVSPYVCVCVCVCVCTVGNNARFLLKYTLSCLLRGAFHFGWYR